MKRNKRTAKAFLLILMAVLTAAALVSAAFAGSDEIEPEKLVLQLGSEWAGVEFELRTDIGKFPVPVVVDENGTLSMELGGSKVYILSRRRSGASAPDPADAPGEAAEPDASPGPLSDTETTDAGGTPALPLVLFLVCLLASAAVLLLLRNAKNCGEEDGDEWEDDEEI